MKAASLLKLDNPRSLLPMGLAVIAIAIIRILWWQYSSSIRGPLGPFFFMICCPFIVMVVGCVLVLIILVARSVYLTRSILPTGLLAVGLFIIFQIRLPELPTPEKTHFLEHQTMYETVVELAKNNALEQTSPDSYCFRAPEAMHLVSAAGCIYIEHTDERGLVVYFNPLESFYHPVAYVEFDTTEFPCGGDPHVEQKIEDHWYVCEYEWN